MDEAYAIVKQWEAVFNAGDADAVAALYAPSATIWGTLTQDLTITSAGHHELLSTGRPRGTEGQIGPHVLSPTAGAGVVDAGQYEFSRAADRQDSVFPARYSFVLMQQNGAWMITHQHSFILPAQTGQRLMQTKGRPCGRPLKHQ